MDVVDASTSFHYAQDSHKKERFRELGYVDSADPGTIRQISARYLSEVKYIQSSSQTWT